METWRSAATEGFEYRRFDDRQALNFIRAHYDSRTEKAYLTCAVPAMKADFFRLCALLIHPGLYVDADMRRSGTRRRWGVLREKSAPLLPWYRRLGRGLLFKRGDRVANGFMIVKNPGDVLLRAMLEQVTDNIEKKISNRVYVVTGPRAATTWLKLLGPEHDYFRGFEFWSAQELVPYMRMAGDLPYKQGDDHWVNAQKKRSIFVEGDLPA